MKNSLLKKVLINVDIVLIGLVYLFLIIFCFVAKDKTGLFLFGNLFKNIHFYNLIIVLFFLLNIVLSIAQFRIKDEKWVLIIRIANILVLLINFTTILYLAIDPLFIRGHLHD